MKKTTRQVEPRVKCDPEESIVAPNATSYKWYVFAALVAFQCAGFILFRISDVLYMLTTPAVIMSCIVFRVSIRDIPLKISIPCVLLAYSLFDSFYGVLPVEPVSLTGKIAVVTGANSGVGLETARQLLALDAKVVLGCRNLERCKAASKQISPVGVFNGGDLVPGSRGPAVCFYP